jgi:DNA-binding XRE family transcriptional regulator
VNHLNSIRRARIESGYAKQEDVALILGIDRTTVTKWETGKNYPHPLMLQKLADLYKCKIDDLLRIENEAIA